MRFLVMLAGFAAVLGVATPAQADPANSGPDASFLAALTKAGITTRTQLWPSRSAKRHAN